MSTLEIVAGVILILASIVIILVVLVQESKEQGLTSAIVNPNDLRLMETIKSCDIFKNHVLYSDSYLEL